MRSIARRLEANGLRGLLLFLVKAATMGANKFIV